MPVYGKDRFYIYGIETILKQLYQERGGGNRASPSCIYVTSGMDIVEIYALYFSHPPVHHAIFITDERHFDAINRLFPGLIKLSLAENLGVEELRQALTIMLLLAEQNQRAGYRAAPFKFTAAEQQIMRLLLRGHSLEEIARIRGVSPTTVSVQRNGLMKRTGTKSLLELCSLYSAMRILQRHANP